MAGAAAGADGGIDGDGGILGPALIAGCGGAETLGACAVKGMAIRSSNRLPPAGFTAAGAEVGIGGAASVGEAFGVRLVGTSKSVSIASSSNAPPVFSEATEEAGEVPEEGVEKGAGVPKRPKGSSCAILLLNPSPLIEGAAPVPAATSFSQEAQIGCILESSPRQVPQKKRWQRPQLPTASRSGWFTQGVTDIPRPFPFEFTYFTLKAIKSTSINASFGKAATCTTARAGGLTLNRWAKTSFKAPKSFKSFR